MLASKHSHDGQYHEFALIKILLKLDSKYQQIWRNISTKCYRNLPNCLKFLISVKMLNFSQKGSNSKTPMEGVNAVLNCNRTYTFSDKIKMVQTCELFSGIYIQFFSILHKCVCVCMCLFKFLHVFTQVHPSLCADAVFFNNGSDSYVIVFSISVKF